MYIIILKVYTYTEKKEMIKCTTYCKIPVEMIAIGCYRNLHFSLLFFHS